ncbi:MAG: chemotaxis protein CheA [Gemmatimonadaceae bacterium]
MRSGGEFYEQFLDDYFAECDEHLATVRRVVLDVESGHANESDRQALLRALHTLKGLSGMVGLVAAEQVAHLMEEILRADRLTGGEFDTMVEALFVGTALLEACVVSRRTATPVPDISAFEARVRAALAETPRESPGRQLVTVHKTSPARTETTSVRQRFTFTPSAELASRGITVEKVRSRLVDLGDIISAAPRVVSGRLLFDFDVALHAGAEPPDSWRSEGLDWEVLPQAAPSDTPAVGGGAQPAPTTRFAAATTNAVRVDLSRLDELMRLVGELVVSRARLEDSIGRVLAKTDFDMSAVTEINDTVEHQLRALRDGITRIRLVPVGEVFERLRFAVRDVAREAGKSIRVEIVGQETEIDKLVVDRILEPLLHIVRNAVSHGIEKPHAREAAGKPSEGTVMLRARAAGDRIIVEVEDDGAGIDTTALVERARAGGLMTSDVLAGDALLDLLCAPGLSTREAADLTSGRGMGMDIAQSTIRGLGGELSVRTVAGEGTCFSMELPLTLMIADALLLDVGGHTMALPQIALREIVELESNAITTLEHNEVISYRGRVMPLVRLTRVFHLADRAPAKHHVLVVGTDTQVVGLVVDRVLGLREIVVHSLTDPLVAVSGISGATELPDGRVSLILDASALARAHRRRGETKALPNATPQWRASTMASHATIG